MYACLTNTLWCPQTLDYNNLAVRGKLQTWLAGRSRDTRLWGLCSVDNGFLVTVEGDIQANGSLCLYEMTGDTMTLLDSHLKLHLPYSPRSDGPGRIYVPHKAGIAVVKIVNNRRLRVARILTGEAGWNLHGVCLWLTITHCV